MNSFSEQASYLSVAKAGQQREQAKSNAISSSQKKIAPTMKGAMQSPEARVPPTVPTKQKTPPPPSPGTPTSAVFITPTHSREQHTRALTVTSPPKKFQITTNDGELKAEEMGAAAPTSASKKQQLGSRQNPIDVDTPQEKEKKGKAQALNVKDDQLEFPASPRTKKEERLAQRKPKSTISKKETGKANQLKKKKKEKKLKLKRLKLKNLKQTEEGAEEEQKAHLHMDISRNHRKVGETEMVWQKQKGTEHELRLTTPSMNRN